MKPDGPYWAGNSTMAAMGLGISKCAFIPDHVMPFLYDIRRSQQLSASVPLSNTGKSPPPFPQGHDPLLLKS